VKSVTFTDGQTVADVTAATSTSLVVKVPLYAETGKVILTMANGEAIETAILAVSKPTICYIADTKVLREDIFSGNTFKLTVANGAELDEVQINGAATQFILEGNTLYILIPSTAVGNATLRFVSDGAGISYDITVKSLTLKETTVWEGMVDLTWGDGGRVYVPWSAFEGVEAGSKLVIYFQQKDVWGQAQINDGSWGNLTIPEIGGATISTSTYNDPSVTSQTVELTQALLDVLNEKKGVDAAYNPDQVNAIIMQGSDWIITKVTVITKLAEPPTEILVDETPHTVGWSGEGEGGAFRVYKENLTALTAGAKLKFYYTPTGGGDAQLKAQDANWGAIDIDDPGYDAQWGTLTLDPEAKYFEWAMTAALVSRIMTTDDGWGTTALVVAGQNVIITKIAILTDGSGFVPPPTTVVLWEDTPVATGSWSGNVTLAATAFANAAVGKQIVVTCSDVASGAQWGIRDGNWANIVEYADLSGTSYTYTITEEGLAALQASGGIFTGHDYSIAKIELK
jgi:hypothetical protein